MNLDYLILVRIFCYFVLAGMFGIAAFLYYFGYYRVKRTKIIQSLAGFFFSQAVYFCILTAFPLMQFIDQGTYLIAVNFIWITLLPSTYFLFKFIEQSIDGEPIKIVETEFPVKMIKEEKK